MVARERGEELPRDIRSTVARTLPGSVWVTEQHEAMRFDRSRNLLYLRAPDVRSGVRADLTGVSHRGLWSNAPTGTVD